MELGTSYIQRSWALSCIPSLCNTFHLLEALSLAPTRHERLKALAYDLSITVLRRNSR